MNEPKPGDIAICSRGHKGLILSHGQVPVKYDGGITGLAWTGIHLESFGEIGTPGYRRIGAPWSSRTPKIIGHIQIALNYLDTCTIATA